MEEGLHFKFTSQNAKWLVTSLVLFELCLVSVFVASAILPIPANLNRLFDLDGEATVPAWFSAMQLFTVGVVLIFSSTWPKIEQIANAWFIRLAGVGFVFLSMDESAGIHERITGLMENVAWAPRFEGQYGTWIILYLVIGLALAAMGTQTILSFFKSYPFQSIILAVGVAVFLAGGIGLEIISYWYLRGDETLFQYKIEVAMEEFMEMAGISMVLYGALLCALVKNKTSNKPITSATATSVDAVVQV